MAFTRNASFASTPSSIELVLQALQTGIQQEGRFFIRPDYDTSVQLGYDARGWRRMIVAWLSETFDPKCLQIAIEFRQNSETLAVAVHYYDRLMSAAQVPSAQLQTAALTCMYIASKVLERRCIRMSHVRRYFGEVCTSEDLRRVELNILYYLNWDVNSFTALDFMHTVLQLVPDSAVQEMIQDYAEGYHRLALSDFHCIGYSQSVLGMACVILACRGCGFDVQPLSDGLAANGVVFAADDIRSAVEHLTELATLDTAARRLDSPSTVLSSTYQELHNISSPDSQMSTAHVAASLTAEAIAAEREEEEEKAAFDEMLAHPASSATLLYNTAPLACNGGAGKALETCSGADRLFACRPTQLTAQFEAVDHIMY